jgi:hypothetical protein
MRYTVGGGVALPLPAASTPPNEPTWPPALSIPRSGPMFSIMNWGRFAMPAPSWLDNAPSSISAVGISWMNGAAMPSIQFFSLRNSA